MKITQQDTVDQEAKTRRIAALSVGKISHAPNTRYPKAFLYLEDLTLSRGMAMVECVRNQK